MNSDIDNPYVRGSEPYVNPLEGLADTPPSVDWKKGEYPPIDDIVSWLHLTVIHQNLFAGADEPIIPEIVYKFRCGQMGKVTYNRQCFGAHGFFNHYGTTDIKVALQNEWLSYLGSLIANNSVDELVQAFPDTARRLKTKSDTNVHVMALIERLRTKDSASTILFNDTPSPTFVAEEAGIADGRDSEPFSGQLTKTFDESLLPPNEIARAIQTPSRPLRPTEFDFSAFANALLPKDGDVEPMGSGVSFGIAGEGGMARVYKVRIEELEMVRAGKVMNPRRVCDSADEALKLIARIKDEAKVTAQLHHPNIVLVYLFGKFRELPYIEMEYVDGFDLRKLIQRKGMLPMELFSALSILSLRGLAYAHNQSVTLNGQEHHGVMHRDIKPANILVGMKDGAVKLSDFGMARPPSVSMHTMPNHAVGTPVYMSPEQMESSHVDTRTDIYSFGATMYEMLAGSSLFPQDNLMDLLRARQSNSYKPLSSFRRDIHRDALHIVDTCLKYNVDERIQSADTLMDHLEDFHRKVTKERPDAVLQDYVLGKKYYEQPSRPSAGQQPMWKRLLGR